MHADSNNSQDFNRWLDAALQARLDGEPREGLEQRVLARLTAEPPQKAFVWWPALAVAAVLVISVALMLLHPPPKSSQSAQTQPMPAITGAPKRGLLSGPNIARVRSLHTAKSQAIRVNRPPKAEQEPRLANFPSPTPETDQERMLAVLAARRNSYEVAGESQNIVPLKDLQIRELDVPLLEGTPPDATSK